MKMNKGFTLIELLIVMAIIAILISISIPSFRGMQVEARKTKAQGDLTTLQIAVESYYKDYNNQYPAVANYQTTLTGAMPPILSSLTYDPFGATNATQYVYALSTNDPTTATYYVLYSVGPNGNGTATVSTAGVVTATNGAIWISNGHQ